MTDQLERLHFMEFNEAPSFAFRDINGDGNPEYIFCSNGHLMVFNKERKPLMDHSFPNGSSNMIELISIDRKDTRMACVSPASAELHLINKGGEESDGFPMTGQTMFAVGRLNSEDGLTLIH
jgi:hypothetical protein